VSTEKPGVYLIEHQPTGRVYVGGTANLKVRERLHRGDLYAGKHHSALTWHPTEARVVVL
jgi:predicted GIY-YIG superfamily endonuclease